MESPCASLGLRLAHDMFFEAHFIDLPLYGLISGVHASLVLDNHSATISLVFINRHGFKLKREKHQREGIIL